MKEAKKEKSVQWTEKSSNIKHRQEEEKKNHEAMINEVVARTHLYARMK